VVKVPSDRTEVVELVIPSGQCSVRVETATGRLALQLKGVMLPCDEQAVSVFEGASNFPLSRFVSFYLFNLQFKLLPFR